MPQPITRVIEIASRHREANHRAEYCYNEMLTQFFCNHDDRARFWAVKTVDYAVGFFHPDYDEVRK